MDQIWLASPSPAMRLWSTSAGPTWRLNHAAMAWSRAAQWNEASWRSVAQQLSRVHAAGPAREGAVDGTPLRWRSLPMSTGWLVWLAPRSLLDDEADGAAALPDPSREPGSEGRAEAMVRRLERVSDAAQVGVWVSDLQSGRSEWNRQMVLIHGAPDAADAPGFEGYVDRFVYPEDRAALRHGRNALLQTGTTRFEIEFRIVRPDGAVRWIHYRSWRDDEAGRAVVVGVAVDATDRIGHRVLAEQSQREAGAVERASAARAEFLARMSHELRTPLNAVLGFAQLMEHDGASAPMQVQQDRIAHIRHAGEQLLGLVGNVLEHLERDLPMDAPGVDIDTVGDAAEPPPAATRVLTMVYIEDNPVNVILVEELVAMRPATRLHCAVNGLDGVARVLEVRPDVVLVDMQLPDIDGFEVLRRLRREPSLEGSAIIALSANGMGDDIARARAAGFDDYWTKPIDFRLFLQGLDSLARKRRPDAAPGG